MKVMRVRPATDLEWDRIWANCEYSTFFHSRDWVELWAQYTRGRMRPSSLLIEFDDNKSAVLVATRERVFKGLVEVVHSSPAGTFGGWLSADCLSDEHCRRLSTLMLEAYPDLSWRVNPYAGTPVLLKLRDRIPDETQALDLRQGFDTIFSLWTKGHRSATKKAVRSGVVITRAESERDWQEYFHVYTDSLRRWGDAASSRYDWALFNEIRNRSSENIILWTARYSDRLIAGALCFYAPRHVAYWHGAALEEFFALRPVNYLLYEVIKDACARSLWWFDFNPSGGHQGVARFKKSFGALPLAAPLIYQHSVKGAALRRIADLMPRSTHEWREGTTLIPTEL
jgi:hypothetical protein